MKMTKMLVAVMLAGLSLAVGTAVANNVVVTSTDLKVPGSGTVTVEFDISWDNSWRDGVNHDACWVFVKYSIDSGTNWSHATMADSGTNPAGFSSGTGTGIDIIVPADKQGVLVQRTAAGTGTVANTDVQFVWDFNADGVSASKSARVKVFAIELVYVSEGSFHAGDGTITSIQGQFEDGKFTNALQIVSEGALTLGGGGAGSLGNNNGTGMSPADDFNDTTSKTLPLSFPKGYGAFYLMKTEISQRQYCDFLNTLTVTQQGNRHYGPLYFNSYRNFIKKSGASPAFFGCDANNNAGAVTNANVSLLNQTNDGEWVACNYLSYMDGSAYADWAALRPMTELEYEKACRGPLSPVADEYAWGNTTLEAATTALTGQNTASETPNQGNCNYLTSTPAGPYRCGSHARAASNRQNAGASYYGALDLSGNLWEQMAAVGNAVGRGFTGTHGDGSLSASGNSNEANWPGLSGGEVTGVTGSGIRGGNFYNDGVIARVSGRDIRNSTMGSGRNINGGFRGARSP